MVFDKSFRVCETIKAKFVTNLETAIVLFYKGIFPAIIPTCPLKGIVGLVNQTINVYSAKDFPLIMEKCRARMDIELYTMQNDLMSSSSIYADLGPPVRSKKKKKNK
jgi:hypothetical protein